MNTVYKYSTQIQDEDYLQFLFLKILNNVIMTSLLLLEISNV